MKSLLSIKIEGVIGLDCLKQLWCTNELTIVVAISWSKFLASILPILPSTEANDGEISDGSDADESAEVGVESGCFKWHDKTGGLGGDSGNSKTLSSLSSVSSEVAGVRKQTQSILKSGVPCQVFEVPIPMCPAYIFFWTFCTFFLALLSNLTLLNNGTKILLAISWRKSLSLS